MKQINFDSNDHRVFITVESVNINKDNVEVIFNKTPEAIVEVAISTEATWFGETRTLVFKKEWIVYISTVECQDESIAIQ